MGNLTRDMFKRAELGRGDAEKMATISESFWKDAFRRLRKNKASMFGVVVIILILLMAIIGPMDPIVGNNADGSIFRYDAAPVLFDDDGVEIEKERIAFVPPRIPVIEKLGIFDGIADIEIGSFDVLVGVLPKDEKFVALKKPNKRKELIEELGIPYHPFEINLIDIYEDEAGELMVDFKVLATGSEETLPFEELASEYTKYRQGNFEFVGSEVDEYGAEMVRVKADYYEINNIKSLYFWFGTDKLAFDVWTRLWIGVRVSLLIAFVSMLVDFSVGITYGTVAGFFGGTKIDTAMMRFTEIVGGIPALVLMIILISIKDRVAVWIQAISPVELGEPGIRLIILIFAISLTGWIGVARIVRAQILKLRDQEFVLASRTLGAGKGRLMTKHLFPNIIGQIVVLATFTIPGAIYYEAFLTFIGLGLPIPMASLGVLVNDGYQAIQTIPELLIIPALVMVMLMLSINLLANGLRDALDPRMR